MMLDGARFTRALVGGALPFGAQELAALEVEVELEVTSVELSRL